MADINIYGTLTNVTGEPIASAEQIGDGDFYQSEINAHLMQGEIYDPLADSGKGAWVPNVADSASVEVDGETITTNAEGVLSVPIDGKTIKVKDSTLSVNIDSETITKSEDGVLSVSEDLRDSMQEVNERSSEILAQYNLVNTVTGADELEPFDENKSYLAGDICLYSKKDDGTDKALYRFKEYKEAGPWRDGIVTQTTLFKEITPNDLEYLSISVYGVTDPTKIKITLIVGEEDPVVLAVDENGDALDDNNNVLSLGIQKGTPYKISCSSEDESYYDVYNFPSTKTITATLPYRYVTMAFIEKPGKAETTQRLHIVFKGLNTSYYDQVQVMIDDETNSTRFGVFNLSDYNGDRITVTDLTIGHEYRLTFSTITGTIGGVVKQIYSTPNPKFVKSSAEEATIEIFYIEISEAFFAISSELKVVDFSSEDIAYIGVNPGVNPFMIRVSEINVGNGRDLAMCNYEVDFTSLSGNFDTIPGYSLAAYMDGELNTTKIIQDCQTIAANTDKTDCTSAAANYARGRKVQIRSGYGDDGNVLYEDVKKDGQPILGYIGTQAQFAFINTNKVKLNTIWKGIYATNFPLTDGKIFWTSSQYKGATNMIYTTGDVTFNASPKKYTGGYNTIAFYPLHIIQ